MSESSLLFLDANTLASPVTRTLIIAGARADGLRWTWSGYVEAEADDHARGQSTRVSLVRRKILHTELSPTASSTKGLSTDEKDRQPSTGAPESCSDAVTITGTCAHRSVVPTQRGSGPGGSADAPTTGSSRRSAPPAA